MTDLPTKRRVQDKHLQCKITTRIDLRDLFARADAGAGDTPAMDYTYREMLNLKNTLALTKAQLDPIWRAAQSSPARKAEYNAQAGAIDMYTDLKRVLRQKYVPNVSNAWVKYWEIYSEYELVKDGQFAFFNAELPGAALSAYAHWAAQHGYDITWRASSLAPDDTNTALLDVYGLWKHNPDLWLMTAGGDHTKHINNGDVTDIKNVLDFAARLGPAICTNPRPKITAGVDFYSQDAGIGLADDEFARQEELNARVHLGANLCGLVTMRPGANFVSKQYTFFEPLTWQLIVVYAQLFREFWICKPLTSRPYNSEVYLVGKGFLGMDRAVQQLLLARLADFSMSPLLNIPVPAEIVEFATTLTTQQLLTIRENVQLYKLSSGLLRKALGDFKRERANAWLRIYPVRCIDPDRALRSNATAERGNTPAHCKNGTN